MVGIVGALSAFYSFPADTLLHDPDARYGACLRLIAKVPTLAAIAYKTNIGEPIVYPRDDLGYAANFLHMLFAKPSAEYKVREQNSGNVWFRCGKVRELGPRLRSPILWRLFPSRVGLTNHGQGAGRHPSNPCGP